MAQDNTSTPLRLLWPLLAPYRRHIAGGVAAMIVASSMMLAMGWGLKGIVDRGFDDPSGGYLNQALLTLLAVILLMAIAVYFRISLMYVAAERVTADLRQRIYEHLLTLDAAYFEKHKTGDQISVLNADTTVLQIVITNNLPSLFRHSLMLTGGTVMLCIVSPAMSGILLAAVPVIIFPMLYFGRRVRARSREAQGRIGDIGAYGQETLMGIQPVQSYSYEAEAARRFWVLAAGARDTAVKYIGVRSLLTAVVVAAVFGAIGVVLWSGGHKVLTGEMTGGDLSAFIFYAAIVAGAVTAISESFSDFNRARGAADRIAQILAAVPTVETPAQPRRMDAVQGAVRFEKVTFSYPTRQEQQALTEASFTIPKGAVAALVGPSGAGKSTVFQLLQRFYNPSSGAVFLDDVNIAECDPRDVRRHLGVVAQDPVIFSMSIADNIRMAKPGASDEEVRTAAEFAQAHAFIKNLPQGYETLVGERGSRLSGGQRQRVAIARAVLKNPRILLLDEATSALDAANEQAVHEALKGLMKGRTTIVIAHRLSTVRTADMIFVMDRGQIAAQGRYEDIFGGDVAGLHATLSGLWPEKKIG